MKVRIVAWFHWRVARVRTVRRHKSALGWSTPMVEWPILERALTEIDRAHGRAHVPGPGWFREAHDLEARMMKGARRG